MKLNQTQSQSGFTIIETLVAITILMIAIAGPLTVAHKGLTAAVYARDQMIGSYLAQDAIEYAKNIRDNNKLASRAWLYGLDDCTTTGQTCRVDTITGYISTCSLYDTCSSLRLDDTRGGYTHESGGVRTAFARVVKIDIDPIYPYHARITATVAWYTGTVFNSVVLESELFDTFR